MGGGRATAGWPTALDVFAGIGGLTLGLRRARFRVLGAIEVDPLALKTYELNFPGVQLFPYDVRRISGRHLLVELGLRKGQLDLLAACPPCQGFSTIRTRNGKTVRDKRNDLILEVLRLAKLLAPRAIMIENVPGAQRHYRFRQLAKGLRDLGYTASWRVLDAVDYGVPQRRRRLVLLAGRNFAPDFPPPLTMRETVRDALGRLGFLDLDNDPLHDTGERRSVAIRKLIEAVPVDGGSRADAQGVHELKCHRELDGFKDVYGRLAWDQPAGTITGGCVNPSKGRFLHPELPRAITLREAAVLQGFPADYRISLERGKYAAAALLGNAFPPSFAAQQARALRPMISHYRVRSA